MSMVILCNLDLMRAKRAKRGIEVFDVCKKICKFGLTYKLKICKVGLANRGGEFYI